MSQDLFTFKCGVFIVSVRFLSVKFDRVPHRWKTYPNWAILSLAANGLLILLLVWQLRDYWSPIESRLNATTTRENLMRELPASSSGLGQRHRLSYQKWVSILAQEAKVVADKPPQHLNILAGDSLSLWFPPDLLPPGKSWLNQGISGEVSAGLLRRLDLFDRTHPETIFVMIGINDLIRGVSDKDILWSYRLIVRRLRRVHPQAQIVVQSILPHGGEESTWEGRDRLLAIPADRIRSLNQELERIAQEENTKYFDLYPLFTDDRGNLRLELTTDGLHLSRQGYLVWRSALILHSQTQLQPPTPNASLPPAP
ncbi:GDSL-type esterase/lipase family protein [Aerosakkonema sp. BLCC-F183]|uniref:GDSL-type esterase/lipase family protein n=1 Tax=Aerosakkonema sp. BLCC-F183 TaxID=3342834 RepID=UPI0035B907B7